MNEIKVPRKLLEDVVEYVEFKEEYVREMPKLYYEIKKLLEMENEREE